MKNIPVTNPPKVADESKVGEYDTLCFSGAGFIWDEVLEYRVWSRGPTECHTFASYDEAERFSEATATRSIVLALVKQVEYFEGNTQRGFVELFRAPGTEEHPDYLLRSEYTLWHAKVLHTSAAQLEQDLGSVVR